MAEIWSNQTAEQYCSNPYGTTIIILITGKKGKARNISAIKNFLNVLKILQIRIYLLLSNMILDKILCSLFSDVFQELQCSLSS